jgi:hypothetical protein
MAGVSATSLHSRQQPYRSWQSDLRRKDLTPKDVVLAIPGEGRSTQVCMRYYGIDIEVRIDLSEDGNGTRDMRRPSRCRSIALQLPRNRTVDVYAGATDRA